MLKITLSTFLVLTISLTTTFGQRIEKVFLDKNDSTKNCYTLIYPLKNNWTGFIFIIPGFGETATEVLQQTDLPNLLAQNGLLTIIPTFKDGVLSFGVDSLSLQSFDNIFKDVVSKHKLADNSFYIGGFSIGGSSAIKIAETSKIKPKAVFAIDPPLDFERFYNSSKRNLRLSIGIEPNQESVYMIGRIEKEMKGTPSTALTNYYKISPYSFSDTTQTAIKGLIGTPLRIYSEPDVNWWIKERGADFTSINVADCSAMINELNRLGNNKAHLITTQNKGFRKPNKKRHPHSWSIVDNAELVKWLLTQK